jgi:hypothetical protein
MADRIELKDVVSGQPLYLDPADVSLVRDEDGGGVRVHTDKGNHFLVEGRSAEVLKRIQAALDRRERSTDQQ